MNELAIRARASLWWSVPLLIAVVFIAWETDFGRTIRRAPPAEAPVEPRPVVTSLLPASFVSQQGWWHVFSQPSELTFENYRAVFNNDAITSALLTTVWITIGGTALTLIVAAAAGYAFAWLEFPGRDWLFLVVFGVLVRRPEMLVLGTPLLIISLWSFATRPEREPVVAAGVDREEPGGAGASAR